MNAKEVALLDIGHARRTLPCLSLPTPCVVFSNPWKNGPDIFRGLEDIRTSLLHQRI
jgi:hypothetical protein